MKTTTKGTNNLATDRDELLLALDQLNQSMETMRQMVERLSQCVEQTQAAFNANLDQPKIQPPFNARNHPMRRKSDSAKPLIADTPIVLH